MIYPVQKSQLKECLEVIRFSFATVAVDFNLNPDNCPGHPSLMQLKHLDVLYEKGILMFYYKENKSIMGFVAIEQADKKIPCWYIEKLAVLPEFRHKGIGEKLMKYALALIEEKKGSYVSIALINEQMVLKNWYAKLGFTEYLVKKFHHLPFNVSFMEYSIFQVEKVSGHSHVLKNLIDALDNDLRERYGNAIIHDIDLKKADESGILFYVGSWGKNAMCCGALRPYTTTQVEIKRMFVDKKFRGQGFSRKLYNHLEEQAKKLGFKEIILETGQNQIEAQALYSNVGFTRTKKFGEYSDDPNSICFTKIIQ